MVGAAGDGNLSEQPVLFFVAVANSLQSARDATRGRPIASTELRDLLDLVQRIARVTLERNFSDRGATAGDNMESYVDLMLLLVALLGLGRLRLVEAVLLHDSLDARNSAVEFLLRIELAQLQSGGAGQLILQRIVRNALDRYYAYEKISDCQKAQTDAGGFGAICFGLNIGETSGGKKSLHGVMQIFSRQWFADLKRSGRQEHCRFFRGNARQFDQINGQAEIGTNGSKLRCGHCRLCFGGWAGTGSGLGFSLRGRFRRLLRGRRTGADCAGGQCPDEEAQ